MEKKGQKRNYASLLYVVIINCLLINCNPKNDNSAIMQNAVQELPVITVATGTANDTLRYTGSVEGISNVEILPQVSGYLRNIHVDEGQYVQRGQVLFRIEDSPYREQLANAKAALALAQANLLTSQINVDKQEPLVQNKVVSNITLKTAKASKAAAEASVMQAKAAVESATINLNFCTIKAPVSGYVGSIPNKLGSLVSSQISQSLTTISDVSKVYVYFSMGEEDFMNFQKRYVGSSIEEKLRNMPIVRLQLAGGSVFKEPGKIEIVEGQFNKTTASISFRATFPNPGGLLRTGNTGVVLIPRNQDDVTLVPISATSQLQDKIYVWKVDSQNKVHQTFLSVLGKTEKDYIVSGINPGETIVKAGFERLAENMPIKPSKK